MCLAVPGRITEIREELGTRMATIDFDGIRKDVCLVYLPEVEVGEYAIVHVGFAISKVDEEAQKRPQEAPRSHLRPPKLGKANLEGGKIRS